MWTRAQLKDKAKEVLKRAYWKAFLVSLITTIGAGAVGRGFSYNFSDLDKGFQNQDFNMPNKFRGWGGDSMYRMHDFDMMNIIPFIMIFCIIFVFALIIATAMRIFLGYPLAVGGARYYISADGGVENLDFLGYIFRKDRYLNTVKTMFLRDLFIFLWSLLFIFPGIIKSYSYSMVKYILADNPRMDYQRAIDISKRMTANNKFNIFVLDLSFIGWFFLGALAFGVGTCFVIPYVHATKMELYLNFRSKVIADGICQPEEFGLVIQNEIEA